MRGFRGDLGTGYGAAMVSSLGWMRSELEIVALRIARADECAHAIAQLAGQWSYDEPLVLDQALTGDRFTAPGLLHEGERFTRRIGIQARKQSISVAAQSSSIPVASTNRLRPKSRARPCIEIATTKYSTRHAVVSSASPGSQIPAIRPAAAANLIQGSRRQYLRGHPTSVRHWAMNATGLIQMMPSAAQVSANTTTGQMGCRTSVRANHTIPSGTVWA